MSPEQRAELDAWLAAYPAPEMVARRGFLRVAYGILGSGGVRSEAYYAGVQAAGRWRRDGGASFPTYARVYVIRALVKAVRAEVALRQRAGVYADSAAKDTDPDVHLDFETVSRQCDLRDVRLLLRVLDAPLREVAEETGVSGERVRQRAVKAMQRVCTAVGQPPRPLPKRRNRDSFHR